jgi:hypothetical protein
VETALAAAAPPLPGGKAGTAPRAALHEAEAGQTCANGAGQAGCFKRPGKRPCAAGSVAGARRRLPCRPFAPPPRPAVAAPGRYCGPVRGAAWPRLITTLAAGRSLDRLDVNAQLRDARQGRPRLNASKCKFAPTGKRQYAGESACWRTGQHGRFPCGQRTARRLAWPPRPSKASFPRRPHSGRTPRHRRGGTLGAMRRPQGNRPLR